MSMSHIRDFILHRLRSKSRHGIHSPFMYALIDECIYAYDPKLPAPIRQHFRQLRHETTVLSGYDLGRAATTQRTVADYARTSSMADFQAALLHRLVAYMAPREVLELGTNLGKSLAAMASASPRSRCVGVEGNAALAEHAAASLHQLGLENAEVRHAAFDDFLAGRGQGLDLVLVDGDHHYASTMRYAGLLKPLMNEGGAIIFHDIYWSRGMKRAWADIKKDRDVTVTLDLYFMGIAWMGKPQAKEDFSVRFPSQLVSLLFA